MLSALPETTVEKTRSRSLKRETTGRLTLLLKASLIFLRDSLSSRSVPAALAPRRYAGPRVRRRMQHAPIRPKPVIIRKLDGSGAVLVPPVISKFAAVNVGIALRPS